MLVQIVRMMRLRMPNGANAELVARLSEIDDDW